MPETPAFMKRRKSVFATAQELSPDTSLPVMNHEGCHAKLQIADWSGLPENCKSTVLRFFGSSTDSRGCPKIVKYRLACRFSSTSLRQCVILLVLTLATPMEVP